MNSALTSHLKHEQHELVLRRANYQILTLALVEAGFAADRLSVLDPGCLTNLLVTEKRKAEWVQVYLNALAANVDLETFPDISECELGSATDTELAGSFATLTTALTGTNNDILFTARKRGVSGNIIQVQYLNGGASQPLTLTLTGSLIKVNLATDGASAVTTTASQILTAISLDTNVKSLIKPVLAAGNTGAGVVTVMAATNLSGGTDF